MSNLQIMILSFLQGFTEFLPVSSSGHLILLSKFSSFPDQGLEMDVAVHVGSILAVMIYFSKDIWQMIKDVFVSRFMPNLNSYGSRFFWLIVIGTIPAVIAGLALHYYGMEELRSTKIVGWNILIFSVFLWVGDKYFPSQRSINDLRVKDAILIGLAQCMALIPGTSRSGITITMSRFLGIQRREAAKFCMMLSVPTIAGAGLLVAWEIMSGDSATNLIYAISGVGYSFIASLAAIFIMMTWLKNYTFVPFVIYRLILGVFLLLYSYGFLN